MYGKNRTQITGLSAATWNTVDLDTVLAGVGGVEAGSTFAIIVATVAGSGAADYGAREVGSSDGFLNNFRLHSTWCIKLDGGNQIQVYGNAAAYFVVGVGSEIQFLGSPVNKSIAQSSAWQTIDLSGDSIPSGAAYVVCRSAGDFAIRGTGETYDNAGADMDDYNRTANEMFVVPIDGGDTFEVHGANVAGMSLDVIGWLPSSDFVWRSNAALRTPAAASTWEDFPDTDSSILIGFIEQKSIGSSSTQTSTRPDGSSFSVITFNPKHCVFFQELNAGAFEFFDAKISSTDTYFAFRGGFKLSSPGSGSMAATESGADTFAATGATSSTGVRLTLRDTDTGALAANLTNLIVSVRATSSGGTVLYSTATGTTTAGGVYELASAALGSIGDYVYITVEKSDNSIVGTFRVQVIDLNA
jgi:hypothetical protein